MFTNYGLIGPKTNAPDKITQTEQKINLFSTIHVRTVICVLILFDGLKNPPVELKSDTQTVHLHQSQQSISTIPM